MSVGTNGMQRPAFDAWCRKAAPPKESLGGSAQLDLCHGRLLALHGRASGKAEVFRGRAGQGRRRHTDDTDTETTGREKDERKLLNIIRSFWHRRPWTRLKGHKALREGDVELIWRPPTQPYKPRRAYSTPRLPRL